MSYVYLINVLKVFRTNKSFYYRTIFSIYIIRRNRNPDKQ